MLGHFERELRIYSRLNHPNIAKFLEVIYQEKYVIIVMEMIQGGTLADYVYDGFNMPRSFFVKLEMRYSML